MTTKKEEELKQQEAKKEEAKRILKEVLLLLPNFLKLLGRLLKDERVPARSKAVFAVVVAYVLNPFDFIPDFIPFLGQIDDLLLICLSLDGLINRVGSDIVLEYWDGDKNIIELIKTVLGLATLFIPEKIKQFLFKKVQAE